MGNINYALLKEKALANFDLLLYYWGINYIKINDKEYDFLSPTRPGDKNYGACRFNTSKGFGADFAGNSFKKQDFESIGKGFDREDFMGFSRYGETKVGFDVIGLCQRIYNRDTYQEAATLLKEQLTELEKNSNLVKVTQEDVNKRLEQIAQKRIKTINWANNLWKHGKDFKGTIAEKYLESKGIFVPENYNKEIKYHSKIYSSDLNIFIPCILFKVSKAPGGELSAIHRIYIAKDGSRKANINNPKKALGAIQGGAIWFGRPSEKLYIAEGPEEALVIKHTHERKFVCSTVYSTNYHSLTIPNYVKEVVLCPDLDEAGISAAIKATKEYSKQNKKVKIHM